MKQKGIKEFFRPFWLKAILSVLLIIFFNLISWFLFLKYSRQPIICMSLGCHAPSDFHRYVASEISPFLFVSIVILSYFLSCLIMRLVNLNKFRDNKGKHG